MCWTNFYYKRLNNLHLNIKDTSDIRLQTSLLLLLLFAPDASVILAFL